MGAVSRPSGPGHPARAPHLRPGRQVVEGLLAHRGEHSAVVDHRPDRQQDGRTGDHRDEPEQGARSGRGGEQHPASHHRPGQPAWGLDRVPRVLAPGCWPGRPRRGRRRRGPPDRDRDQPADDGKDDQVDHPRECTRRGRRRPLAVARGAVARGAVDGDLVPGREEGAAERRRDVTRSAGQRGPARPPAGLNDRVGPYGAADPDPDPAPTPAPAPGPRVERSPAPAPARGCERSRSSRSTSAPHRDTEALRVGVPASGTVLTGGIVPRRTVTAAHRAEPVEEPTSCSPRAWDLGCIVPRPSGPARQRRVPSERSAPNSSDGSGEPTFLGPLRPSG